MAITLAGEDGESGILRESGIGLRQIAECEDGAASGFESAGVETIGAEAGGNLLLRRIFLFGHNSSITQEAALTVAGEFRIRTSFLRQTIDTPIEVESPGNRHFI
jgi:hypothetical protein